MLNKKGKLPGKLVERMRNYSIFLCLAFGYQV